MMKSISDIIHNKNLHLNMRDADGIEVYYENTIGFWVKRQIDSKGNVVYYPTDQVVHREDTEGFWYIWNYNYENNRTNNPSENFPNENP